MNPGGERQLTILLIGAGGQIGFSLQRRLVELGRVVSPNLSTLDLSEADSIRSCVREVGPDLIVNAAAYTAVDRAEAEPELCWAINATAPRVLGAEAAAIGAALVHYSTDYVFDGTLTRPYTEEDEAHPLSEYGRSKLEGERGVLESGAAHLILRTSWVYGARGRNFMLTILRLAREREELHVVADQRGAPTWCDAIAEGTEGVLRRLAASDRSLRDSMAEVSGIYHLTANGATTWHAFAEAILALDPHKEEQRCRRVVPITTAEYPTPARRPPNSTMDCSKAARVLGVRLQEWMPLLRAALREF